MLGQLCFVELAGPGQIAAALFQFAQGALGLGGAERNWEHE